MDKTDKFKVGAQELDQALDLTIDGGRRCETVGEAVDFITRLVGDEAVLRQLDPTASFLEVEPHRWWFRGAQSDHYPLHAGLFRTGREAVCYPSRTENYKRLEQRIRHEYSLMTRGRFPELSDDPWDRLFEMQHYGLPTRLLDWTFSIGQALWFALQPRSGPPNGERPVIWILNPRLLAKASLGVPALDDFAYLERHGNDDEMRAWKPAADRPTHPKPGWILDDLSKRSGGHFPVLASWTNPRIAAQMGCFTLQSGLGESPSESLEQYAKSTKERFLLKVCFEPDPQLLKKAYQTLSMIGVNRYTLFPEVQETCAWIKELRQLRR